MKKIICKQSEKIYWYILALILIHSVNIGRTYMPYFLPDELGYWAGAAWINHIDWSPVISQGGYYGWGYGIFLAPLVKIFSGKWLYYSAILLNIAMNIIMFMLLVEIYKRMKPGCKKKEIYLCSLCVTSYSYICVYTQLTMSEILLSVFFILSVYCLYWYMEKPGILRILCLAICLSFMVFTHFRMLVIVIAVAFSFVLIKKYPIGGKNIHYLAGIVFLIVFLILGMIIKNALVQEQYMCQNSTYNMQNDSILDRLSGLLNVFTIKFWKDFYISLIAKWFYIGLASLYMIIWGILYLFKSLFEITRLQEQNVENMKNRVVSGYILSSFILAFLLNVYTMSKPERIDQLYYGRYVENIILPIIGIGILFVQELFGVKKFFVLNIFFLASSLLLYSYTNVHSIIVENVLPLQCAGFAGLPINEENYGVMYSFGAILVYFTLIMTLYLLVKKKTIFICGICMIWIIISNFALNRVIYQEEMQKRYNDIRETALVLTELENEDKEIYYVVNTKEGQAYYDSFFLQFCLKDITLHIIEDISYIDKVKICVVNKQISNLYFEQLNNSNILWENDRCYILSDE